MKIVYALLVFLAVESCNVAPKYHKRGAANESQDNVPEGMSGEENSQQDKQPLMITENHGSALRFADSNALTDMYGRVFKQREFGFAHCEKDLPRHPDDCKNVFRPGERPDMGTFDMHEPGINRGPLNIQQVTSLRLSYIRTLRGMLVRECDVLINRETAALKAGMGKQNIFLRGDEPKAEDYEFFFKSILGIEKTSLGVDFDAAGYVEAFKKSVGSATDKVAATRSTNMAICVSIAMDPHIFLY